MFAARESENGLNLAVYSRTKRLRSAREIGPTPAHLQNPNRLRLPPSPSDAITTLFIIKAIKKTR
ncbi:hypothetical protein NECAME_13038 [Necator americanus]|uniref:Uncharacterized protein n=1 Tax=Necator americanus TaxID=51031 RepID=W2SXS6_NECAM|nr:hypothetical protein NECAME_13038 [Necator americanus]ETN74328.1 hypothetical protein NECAME_13038 [Necator americanus]